MSECKHKYIFEESCTILKNTMLIFMLSLVLLPFRVDSFQRLQIPRYQLMARSVGDQQNFHRVKVKKWASRPLTTLMNNHELTSTLEKIESVLSANKNLKRSPLRKMWTFVVAPSLTMLAVTGVLVKGAVNTEGTDYFTKAIGILLDVSYLANILHIVSALICFRIAKAKNIESFTLALKGFISGFIVATDLLETEDG